MILNIPGWKAKRLFEEQSRFVGFVLDNLDNIFVCSWDIDRKEFYPRLNHDNCLLYFIEGNLHMFSFDKVQWLTLEIDRIIVNEGNKVDLYVK